MKPRRCAGCDEPVTVKWARWCESCEQEAIELAESGLSLRQVASSTGMSKSMVHRILHGDESRPARLCQGCGDPVPKGSWKWCESCVILVNNGTLGPNNRTRTTIKKNFCEDCGFQGKPCQLDVQYVDGDRTNSEPSNTRTLCSNCHRLYIWGHRTLLDLDDDEQRQVRDFVKKLRGD